MRPMQKVFFYAMQSIRQLSPAAIEEGQMTKDVAWTVPALAITDSPRFDYRD